MRLASLFCNHAILQRDIPIPVWGWCAPRSRVRVTLAGRTAETFAGDDGKFVLRLPPMPAGGPHVLEALQVGAGRAEAQDVWVGEVWLASGQSNMQWTVAPTGETIDKAIPGIRMFSVPNVALPGRQAHVEGVWKTATPEAVQNFSAVAFHFARRLHDELKVPVGIIASSWGGTRVEAWTSREALMQQPATCAEMQSYEATFHSPAFFSRLGSDDARTASVVAGQVRGLRTDPGNEGFGRGWARADLDDAAWPNMTLPSTWQANRLAFSGALWFRREISAPADWQGKDLLLCVGAVDKHDVTYFNGEQVGATGTDLDESHWNKPREYRVPARLVKPGKNVIAVRAFSFVYHGGLIGPANKMSVAPVSGNATPIPLEGPWRYAVEHDFGKVYLPGAAPYGPGNPNTPAILFDNQVAPLAPYALRGAIWYQGESNVGNASQYRELMVGMIRDWRRTWGQGDFPFLMVQLANYQAASEYQRDSQWALLRESQLQSVNEPGVGMAVIIDIGEANDIHPRNKRDVGYRLAQWALYETYERASVASGPLCSGMTIEGDRIRVRFRNSGKGLVAKGGALKTFAIAGSDKMFFLAEAVIDGNSVVVRHPDVMYPVAVRYAWADNPEGCNLYNVEGLPASPFRTDVW